MGNLVLVMGMVAVDYVCVLVAILVDLRSGVMNSKRSGRCRTSHGYRKTVEKAGRYYVTLIAMTMIDAMVVGSLVFLSLTGGPKISPLPVFTTLGAIGLCLIELRSIYENSQVDSDYDKVLEKFKDVLKNQRVREILKELIG
ncbi:MAG: phage holin family protein [Paramuribaculum sp.]|nr:phage holin family protein [Paramuribaculum sp.]